jgi:heme/copper-type cytochrome/quinol oxidase subunit 4
MKIRDVCDKLNTVFTLTKAKEGTLNIVKLIFTIIIVMISIKTRKVCLQFAIG